MNKPLLRLGYAMAALTLSGSADAATCLARTIKNSKGADVPFTIVVPAANVADLLTSGFSVADCGPATINLAKYRDQVCETASSGNEAVQERIKEVIGVSPAALCAAAKLLAAQS